MSDSDYYALTKKLREDGCAAGYIKSREVDLFPDIEDLSKDWARVCLPFLQGVKDHYLEDSEKEHTVNANTIISRTLYGTFMCCQYAGIGAVYCLDQDPEALETEGVFKMLTESNPIMEVDEYVVDAVGFPYQSPKETALRSHLKKNVDNIMEIIRKSSDRQSLAVVCMHALYQYGIQLGMTFLAM